MKPSRSVLIARTIFALSIVALVTATTLSIITRSVPMRVFAPRWLFAPVGFSFAVVGLFVASKRPGNPTGWIFSIIGLIGTSAWFLSEYATFSISRRDGSLPMTVVLSWVQNWLWIPMFSLLQVAVLMYPNGKLISPRWRIVFTLVLLGSAGFLFSGMFSPSDLDQLPPGSKNPYVISESLESIESLSGLAFLGGLASALASLVVRYRRSRGEEREQMRWLVFPLSFIVAGVAFILIGDLTPLGTSSVAEQVAAPLIVGGFGAVPIAAGMAILRYRLYDIEIIINRTIVLGLVAGFITLVYVGVVAGIGAALGSRGGSNVALPIVATAMVGVAFQPVRTRAHALANRFVYGKRTTPYEALSALASHASEARSEDELVAGLARLAVESTAAKRAVVWIKEGEEMRAVATWPEERIAVEPQRVADVVPTLPGASTAYPVMHQSELLGAIGVDIGAETVTSEDDKLLSHLAAQAGIAIRTVRDSVPLPVGVVTFLMTDVQGSTRLWEEHPEQMATALSEHDALMRRLVSSHDGILIKSRGEGDSTFSAFTDPTKAVGAAVAIQRAFESYPWPTPRPLRVRAALHTGEAELRDRDYYGQVVNRCARLRAIAEGGQTVLSSATFRAVERSLPDGASVSDLGEQQLKDLDEPERVYQITPGG